MPIYCMFIKLNNGRLSDVWWPGRADEQGVHIWRRALVELQQRVRKMKFTYNSRHFEYFQLYVDVTCIEWTLITKIII